MKKLLFFSVFFGLFFSAYGQENHLLQVQDKLVALQWLEGHWQGSGWMMNRQAERMPFDQQEDIRFRLNGTVLQIEGLGTTGADTVHHALAMVSYDPQSAKYRFVSYTANGGSQYDAAVEVRPNTLVWKMQMPGAITRYTIILNEKGQWFEIGEFSRDEGKTWTKFFEMTLNKINSPVVTKK